MLWQYITVFVILATVLGWILYRLFSPRCRGRNDIGCTGCTLADVCQKKQPEQKPTRQPGEKPAGGRARGRD